MQIPNNQMVPRENLETTVSSQMRRKVQIKEIRNDYHLRLDSQSEYKLWTVGMIVSTNASAYELFKVVKCLRT